MLTIESMEEAWDAEGLTLVMHPALRRAVEPYLESFDIGARSFLRGESDGLYFLPLESGYVRLRFSMRTSPTGCLILRIDAASADGLACIKADGTRLRS